MLKAFGVEVCGDLIAKRALLSALFSKVTSDSAMAAALVDDSLHSPRLCAKGSFLAHLYTCQGVTR